MCASVDKGLYLHWQLPEVSQAGDSLRPVLPRSGPEY